MGSATECDQVLLNLDERQLRALDVLARGGTHREAADAAGVARVSVSRWNSRHPGFIAERNLRRMEQAQHSRSNIIGILNAAVELLGARVVEGDVGAAIALLKWSGAEVLLQAQNAGPIESDVVYAQMLGAETAARFREPLLASMAEMNGEDAARERARDEARIALLAANGLRPG